MQENQNTETSDLNPTLKWIGEHYSATTLNQCKIMLESADEPIKPSQLKEFAWQTYAQENASNEVVSNTRTSCDLRGQVELGPAFDSFEI